MRMREGGPAALLKKGSNWLDAKVVFKTKDHELDDAAMMAWRISRTIRGRQGEFGYSHSELGNRAGVQRQTVAAVVMGTVWADSITLGRICSVLGLSLEAVLLKDPEG